MDFKNDIKMINIKIKSLVNLINTFVDDLACTDPDKKLLTSWNVKTGVKKTPNKTKNGIIFWVFIINNFIDKLIYFNLFIC